MLPTICNQGDNPQKRTQPGKLRAGPGSKLCPWTGRSPLLASRSAGGFRRRPPPLGAGPTAPAPAYPAERGCGPRSRERGAAGEGPWFPGGGRRRGRVKTRRFENTLRDREPEAGGARRRPVGSFSDALSTCLRVPVPAGPSGELPPPVWPGPLRGAGRRAERLVGPSPPGPRPRRAGPAGASLRPCRAGPRCGEGLCGCGAPRGLLKRLK